jgi:hypothetical protein
MIFIIQIKSLEIALSGNGNSGKMSLRESENSGECPFGEVEVRNNVPSRKWRFRIISLQENGIRDWD